MLTRRADYRKSGPKDIYELGVPRDARMMDETAAKEVTAAGVLIRDP